MADGAAEGLKGELLTNDIGLLRQRRSDLSRYPARRLHRIKAGRRWPSPPLLSNLVFGTDRDWSEHQGGAQYHDDGADVAWSPQASRLPPVLALDSLKQAHAVRCTRHRGVPPPRTVM